MATIFSTSWAAEARCSWRGPNRCPLPQLPPAPSGAQLRKTGGGSGGGGSGPAAETAKSRVVGKRESSKKPPTSGSSEPLDALLESAKQKVAFGDVTGANAIAARAVARHPESIIAAHLHGTLSLQLGALDDAVRSLESALRLAPAHWSVATNLASALLQLGRAAEAIGPARTAVDLQPTLIAARVVLANAQRVTGDLRGALATAREALRLYSTGVPQPEASACDDPSMLMGDILVDLGELQEAWSIALRAAEKAQHVGQAMAQACTLAGRVQEANGQYEGALSAFEKAGRLAPEAPRANQLRTAMITKALRACLPARAGDVFITTFPKSGTTWMQQVVCMLCGEPADVDIQMRAPYIEAALATSVFSLSALAALKPPRIFKTHAAWPQLPVAGCSASAPPPEARVIVVVRDPRDVMVSLYYHSRSIRGISYQGSWDEWFEEFLAGTAPLPMGASDGGASDGSKGSSSDWFEHTIGWWRISRAHPEHVLWVRYEDMLSDPDGQVRAVGRFLTPRGGALDAERLGSIVSASSFGAMKQRHEACAENEALRNEGEQGHFRKGKAGDWRSHLSPKQQARFEAEMARRLAGTGLEAAFC